MKSSGERHSSWPLIAGIVLGVLALTAGPALAALTFSGTSITGDSSSVIDATGTISIGASSATGITIGRSGITATFPGTVTITGATTSLQNLVVSGACTGCGVGNFTAGGDLSGSSTSQSVIGLQGRAVSSTTPSTSQVLMWNGSFWTPTNVSSTSGITAINGLSNATTSIVGAGTVTVSTSSPNIITITGTGTGAITINSLTTSTFQIQGTANQITVATTTTPGVFVWSLPTALSLTNATATGNLAVIGTVAAGTSILAPNINGTINASACITGPVASWCPTGATDMGVILADAVAQLPAYSGGTHVGTVYIAPGSYMASTTVSIPQTVSISGWGAKITVASSLSGPFIAWGDATNTTNVLQNRGIIQGLELYGAGGSGGSTDGIFLGGDPAGVITPSNAISENNTMIGVELHGFRKALRFGSGVWGFTCYSCRIHDNAYGGIVETNATTTGEHLNFSNTNIYNNTSYGLYAIGTGQQGPSFFWQLDHSMIDYNAEGVVGPVTSVSTHYEQQSGLIVDASAAGAWMNSTNDQFWYQATTGSDSCFVKLNSSYYSSFVGQSFYTNSGHTVTNQICNGVPFVPVSQIQSGVTGQTANYPTSGLATIYTTPNAGWYDVCAQIEITRAATTNSTLPSVAIGYTSAVDSTFREPAMPEMYTQTWNATWGGEASCLAVYAASNTAIQIATNGYTSSGATSMAYALSWKVTADSQPTQ